MTYNNGMPASYDSWKLSGPPENHCLDNLQEELDNTTSNINNLLDDLPTSCEFHDDLSSLDMIICDLQDKLKQLHKLADDYEDIKTSINNIESGDL